MVPPMRRTSLASAKIPIPTSAFLFCEGDLGRLRIVGQSWIQLALRGERWDPRTRTSQERKGSMRIDIRFAMLIAASLALQGCIGLGAWTLGSRSESSDHPKIDQTRGSLDIRTSAVEGTITTAAELRQGWGDPDRVEPYGDHREEWIYKTNGLRWAGMVLYVVIIPLPAMIPVGSQYVSFLVHDGQIERATRTDWAFKAGAYCGFFGMTYGGLGCGTGTFEESQRQPSLS